MASIRREIHIAVYEHREGDKGKAREYERFGGNKMPLQQLRRDGREQRDDQRARPEYEAGIDGTIAVERLQHLRNQRRGSKQSNPEDKEEDACNCEVTIFE